MEIAPGIHKVNVSVANSPLGNLNCYLIEGKAGWTMIDTGFLFQNPLIPLKQILRKNEFSDNALDWANEIDQMLHTDGFKEIFTAMMEKKFVFKGE